MSEVYAEKCRTGKYFDAACDADVKEVRNHRLKLRLCCADGVFEGAVVERPYFGQQGFKNGDLLRCCGSFGSRIGKIVLCIIEHFNRFEIHDPHSALSSARLFCLGEVRVGCARDRDEIDETREHFIDIEDLFGERSAEHTSELQSLT